MTDAAAVAVIVVAFFALVGWIVWLAYRAGGDVGYQPRSGLRNPRPPRGSGSATGRATRTEKPE